MRRIATTVCLVIGLAVTFLHEGRAFQGNAQAFRAVATDGNAEFIVAFHDNVAGRRGRTSRADVLTAEINRSFPTMRVRRTYKTAIQGFSADMPVAVARALSRDPRVKYVEQVLPIQGGTVQSNPPNWGLDRIDQRTNLDLSYTYGATGSGVRVYVVDSGIDTSNADFGGRASLGPNFAGGSNVDCHGHGTHVAGIIGSATYGVAKGASLVSVRVFGCNNMGSTAGLLDAIDWITDHYTTNGGPAIVNFSGGVYGVPWSFSAVDDAVQNSFDDTALLWVVAAGNTYDWVFYNSPARVDDVLTVGATDGGDDRAAFSSYGPQVDIYAPGISIYSLGFNCLQVACNGTSYSAPLVAGIGARFLEVYPWAPGAHIVNQIVYVNSTPNVVPNPGPGTPNRFAFSGFLDGIPEPAADLLGALHLTGPRR